MKTIELLFKNLTIPLLLLILTPIATAIGSKTITGNWRNWFEKIPTWGYIVFVILMGTLFVIVLVKKRLKQISEENESAPPLIVRPPILGYRVIGNLPYKGGKWSILYPNLPHWNIYDHNQLIPLRLKFF